MELHKAKEKIVDKRKARAILNLAALELGEQRIGDRTLFPVVGKELGRGERGWRLEHRKARFGNGRPIKSRHLLVV